MPKVSAAHRAARREQILGAAMRVVARKGFAGLTMADVITEAGLSAGAVYTYFPGKAEILANLGGEEFASVLAALDTALDADPMADPDRLLAVALTRVEAIWRQVDLDVAVAVIQVMAASMLSGEETVVHQRIREIRSRWVTLARRLQDAGRLPADADPEAVGAVLLSLLPGFVLQSRILEPLDPLAYAAGLRALMTARLDPA